MEQEEKPLPVNLLAGMAAEESSLVRRRLAKAVMAFHDQVWNNEAGGSLCQVWLPEQSEDGDLILRTKGLPFCVAGVGDLLALFRCISCRFCFGTDVHNPHTLGAPGRVFTTGEPEMSSNVQKYSKEVYLRASEAQQCRVHSTIVIPLFLDRHRSQALGVLEVVQTAEDMQFSEIVNNLGQILEACDLFTSADKFCSKEMSVASDTVKTRYGSPAISQQADSSGSAQADHGICDGISAVPPASDAVAPAAADADESVKNGSAAAAAISQARLESTAGPMASFAQEANPNLVTGAAVHSMQQVVQERLPSLPGVPMQGLQTGAALQQPGAVHAAQADARPAFRLQQEVQLADQRAAAQLSSSLAQQSLQEWNAREEAAATAVASVAAAASMFAPAAGTGTEGSADDEDGEMDEAGDSYGDGYDMMDDLDGEGTFEGRQRRGKGSGNPGKPGKRLRLEDLQSQFGVGLKEAAQRLGICPTTLKRACRRHGIQRWPRRQLIKLSKAIDQINATNKVAPPLLTSSTAQPGTVLEMNPTPDTRWTALAQLIPGISTSLDGAKHVRPAVDITVGGPEHEKGLLLPQADGTLGTSMPVLLMSAPQELAVGDPNLHAFVSTSYAPGDPPLHFPAQEAQPSLMSDSMASFMQAEASQLMQSTACPLEQRQSSMQSMSSGSGFHRHMGGLSLHSMPSVPAAAHSMPAMVPVVPKRGSRSTFGSLEDPMSHPMAFSAPCHPGLLGAGLDPASQPLSHTLPIAGGLLSDAVNMGDGSLEGLGFTNSPVSVMYPPNLSAASSPFMPGPGVGAEHGQLHRAHSYAEHGDRTVHNGRIRGMTHAGSAAADLHLNGMTFVHGQHSGATPAEQGAKKRAQHARGRQAAGDHPEDLDLFGDDFVDTDVLEMLLHDQR